MSTRRLERSAGTHLGSELPSLPVLPNAQTLTPPPMAKVEWAGASSTPGTEPAAGQTTQAYLDGKNFQRRSHEALSAAFHDLMKAWPKDTPPGETPSAFTAQAAALDAYKAGLASTLSGAKGPTWARQVVADLNVLHGKPGHTENVVATTLALLANAEVSAALGLASPAARREAGLRLAQAAGWLNLCDLEIPVGILCAPRRLSDDELARYVKPRAERSAALVAQLGLEGPEVVRLIQHHRGGPDRPGLAQLLDLADQAAAMAAKPFFQRDGQVDAEKLGASLRGNAERAGVSASLLEAVLGAITGGALDAAQKQARDQDLWIR